MLTKCQTLCEHTIGPGGLSFTRTSRKSCYAQQNKQIIFIHNCPLHHNSDAKLNIFN